MVHETLSSIPEGFLTKGPASGDLLLSLRFALTQNNMDDLERKLYDISNPSSDGYGKHLTQNELASYVRPKAQTSLLVADWLSSHELTGVPVSFSGDILEVTLSVRQANKLLNADFHVFSEHSNGKQSLRTLAYSIPSNLKGHLDHIHPTIR